MKRMSVRHRSEGQSTSGQESPATSRPLHRGRDVAERYALLGFLLLLILAFSLLLPSTFPTTGNFVSMIEAQAILLFLALAVTLPLRAGDFDLSVGQTMVFTAILVSILTTQEHLSVPLAIVAAIATGAVIGAINGTLIVVVGLNAFVTTLGMMTLLEGIGYAMTNYNVIFNVPSSLENLSRHQIDGIPLEAYFGWALLLVLWYLYDFTPFGRHLLVTGEKPEAARLSGIRIGAVRFSAFLGAALISAVAGILLAGQLGAVDPTTGPQYLLTPYAAAFLGSTTVRIGQFNALGTLIGLYLLVVGITGLELNGAQPWVSEVFNGGALIAAVLFARMTRGRIAA